MSQPPAAAGAGVQPLTALKGKRALVLGGTRGVGGATTEKLARSGCDVLATYSADDAAAADLTAALADAPATVDTVRCDARDRDAVTAVLRAAGPLDILVHCVPSMHPTTAVGADVDTLMGDISAALGPLLTAAGPAAEQMSGRGGRIVVVSASVARSVAPRFAGLGAAKSALESIVRYLAVELAPQGVTVNAVSASKLDKGPATTLPEVARALAARTPAGRLATPQDIADVIALLCLPEARLVQGQVITVDGGLHLLG